MKTMAKIELRSVGAMFIYFLVSAIIIVSQIPSAVKNILTKYLCSGLASLVEQSNFSNPTGLFNNNIRSFTFITFLGILILIYLSFKNDSNHQVGRFLKSLPFTSKERYLIKVGVGIATFTIPYIFYGISLSIAHHYYVSQLSSIYEITLVSTLYSQLLPLGSILQYLFLMYLFVVGSYLFIMMFEYLISSNVASIIISILVGLSPIFISESLLACFRTNLFYEINRFINRIYWSFIPKTAQVAYFTGENAEFYYALGSVETISSFGTTFIALLIAIIICTVCGMYLCKRKALEQDDILMPDKWFRILFIVGVTVCSAFLFSDSYLAFHYRDTMRIVWFIVGGAIGFVIAWFISNIGLKRVKGAKK